MCCPHLPALVVMGESDLVSLEIGLCLLDPELEPKAAPARRVEVIACGGGRR
jgi:hypothetical protein